MNIHLHVIKNTYRTAKNLNLAEWYICTQNMFGEGDNRQIEYFYRKKTVYVTGFDKSRLGRTHQAN